MNPQMNRYQNPFSGQMNVPVIPGKMVMNENAITPQDIPMIQKCTTTSLR